MVSYRWIELLQKNGRKRRNLITKKKLSALALALSLAVSMAAVAAAAPAVTVEQIPPKGTAYAASQTVSIDGRPVSFQMYALKDAGGNGTNYVKLRDLAYALNGTAAQFYVEYDGAIQLVPGRAYTSAGGEMTTPFSGDRAYTGGTTGLKVSDQAVGLTAFTLLDDQGGGYTYFKLRDLGTVLGFGVGWDDAAKQVTLDTGSGNAQSISDQELIELARDLMNRADRVDDYIVNARFVELDYNDTITVDHAYGETTCYRVIGCQTVAQVEEAARQYWYSIYSRQVPFEWHEDQNSAASQFMERNGGVYYADLLGLGGGSTTVVDRLISRSATEAVFTAHSEGFGELGDPFELTLVLEDGAWRYLPG